MAKRSRRERRQLAEKQQKSTPDSQPVTPEPIVSVAEPAASKATGSNRSVDFVREYYYVYTDLRTIVIMAVLMIAVLIGLSFVI